jgi:hypothetical protein
MRTAIRLFLFITMFWAGDPMSSAAQDASFSISITTSANVVKVG